MDDSVLDKDQVELLRASLPSPCELEALRQMDDGLRKEMKEHAKISNTQQPQQQQQHQQQQQ